MLEDFGQKTKQPSLNVIVNLGNREKSPKLSISKAKESWILCDTDTYAANGSIERVLPPGAYTIQFNHQLNTFVFKKAILNIDVLITPSTGVVRDIIKEIESFWSKKSIYKKLGFLHYRGYLLYGPQGSGKTCVVQLVIKDIVDRGGLVFICEDSYEFVPGIKEFRNVEPDRQIVCLFEDIDALAKEDGESGILAFLDGESKIENVLNLATTNYPELLDRRIVNRPRRFDRVVKIDYPDNATRKSYLETKLDKKELSTWVQKTEGLSFAGLAELVIRVKCLEQDFDIALAELLDAQKITISSNTSNGSTSTGFIE